MVVGLCRPYPRDRRSIPRLRSPLNKHTHTPIKQAVFIIILLTALAWLTLIASDSGGAETPARPTQTSITTTSTSSTTLPPTTTTTLPPTTTTTFINRTEPSVNRNPVPQTQCPQPIVDLIHKHFDKYGPGVAEWFTGIVWRESNCQPTAANRGSGCLGLTQTALPLHADLYAALGYDWTTTWMDPDINLAVAASLYAGSGKTPWNL